MDILLYAWPYITFPQDFMQGDFKCKMATTGTLVVFFQNLVKLLLPWHSMQHQISLLHVQCVTNELVFTGALYKPILLCLVESLGNQSCQLKLFLKLFLPQYKGRSSFITNTSSIMLCAASCASSLRVLLICLILHVLFLFQQPFDTETQISQHWILTLPCTQHLFHNQEGIPPYTNPPHTMRKAYVQPSLQCRVLPHCCYVHDLEPSFQKYLPYWILQSDTT